VLSSSTVAAGAPVDKLCTQAGLFQSMVVLIRSLLLFASAEMRDVYNQVLHLVHVVCRCVPVCDGQSAVKPALVHSTSGILCLEAAC